MQGFDINKFIRRLAAFGSAESKKWYRYWFKVAFKQPKTKVRFFTLSPIFSCRYTCEESVTRNKLCKVYSYTTSLLINDEMLAMRETLLHWFTQYTFGGFLHYIPHISRYIALPPSRNDSRDATAAGPWRPACPASAVKPLPRLPDQNEVLIYLRRQILVCPPSPEGKFLAASPKL
jgi:hypothetical protein